MSKKDTTRSERYKRLNETQPGIDEYTQNSLPYMNSTATPYYIGRHTGFIDYDIVSPIASLNRVAASAEVFERSSSALTTAEANKSFMVLGNFPKTFFPVASASITMAQMVSAYSVTATTALRLYAADNPGGLKGVKFLVRGLKRPSQLASENANIRANWVAIAAKKEDNSQLSETELIAKIVKAINGEVDDHIQYGTSYNRESLCPGIIASQSGLKLIVTATEPGEAGNNFAVSNWIPNHINFSYLKDNPASEIIFLSGGTDDGPGKPNVPFDTFKIVNNYENDGNSHHPQRYLKTERNGELRQGFFENFETTFKPGRFSESVPSDMNVAIGWKTYENSSGDINYVKWKLLYFNEIEDFMDTHVFHARYNPNGYAQLLFFSNHQMLSQQNDIADPSDVRKYGSQTLLQYSKLKYPGLEHCLHEIPKEFWDRPVFGNDENIAVMTTSAMTIDPFGSPGSVGGTGLATYSNMPAISLAYLGWNPDPMDNNYGEDLSYGPENATDGEVSRSNLSASLNAVVSDLTSNPWYNTGNHFHSQIHFPNESTGFRLVKKHKQDSAVWHYGQHPHHKKDTVYKEQPKVRWSLHEPRINLISGSLYEINSFRGSFNTVEYLLTQEAMQYSESEPYFELYNTETYDHKLSQMGSMGPGQMVFDITSQHVTFSPQQRHPLGAFTGVVDSNNPLGVPRPIRHYVQIRERDDDSCRFLDHPNNIPFSCGLREVDEDSSYTSYPANAQSFPLPIQYWGYETGVAATSSRFNQLTVQMLGDWLFGISSGRLLVKKEFAQQLSVGDLVRFKADGSTIYGLNHNQVYKIASVTNESPLDTSSPKQFGHITLYLEAQSSGAVLVQSNISNTTYGFSATPQIGPYFEKLTKNGYNPPQVFLEEGEWIEPDPFSAQEFIDRTTGAEVQLDKEIIAALQSGSGTTETIFIEYSAMDKIFTWSTSYPTRTQWYPGKIYNIRSDVNLQIEYIFTRTADSNPPLFVAPVSDELETWVSEDILYKVNNVQAKQPALWVSQLQGQAGNPENFTNNIIINDSTYNTFFFCVVPRPGEVDPAMISKINIIRINPTTVFSKITNDPNGRLQRFSKEDPSAPPIARANLSDIPFDAVEMHCGWPDEAGQRWDSYWYRDLLR